jgi:hypothetical protein
MANRTTVANRELLKISKYRAPVPEKGVQESELRTQLAIGVRYRHCKPVPSLEQMQRMLWSEAVVTNCLIKRRCRKRRRGCVLGR